MADFAKWKRDATPDETSVSVCLNRRLFREFVELSQQLERRRVDGMLDQPEDVQALAAEVVDLKRRIDADRAEHTFVFGTVGYRRWRELVEAHPPSEQQKADNRYAEFDEESFPEAAIAASAVSPELTVDDAGWLREHLPRQEFWRLFDAVLQVNVGGSSIPKSVSATVDQLASVLSSTTAEREESLSPPSEGES